MTNSQCEKQFVQSLIFALFNGFQQIVCRFFPHPFQCQELFFFQFVQVCRCFHQSCIQKLVDYRGAAAFNIHGIPGRKMNQAFPAQRRAMGICTAVSRFPFFAGNRPTAFRALLRHDKRHRRFRPQFFYNGKHLGNDFRRFVDDDRITDPDIFFQNKIFIVEGSAAYSTAG